MTPSIVDEYQEVLSEANRVREETQQLADDLRNAQSYTQVVNQVDGCLYLNGGTQE